jgi:hypothetical protein
MLPLYREATASERARQRAAAEPYRFTAIQFDYDGALHPRAASLAEFSPLGPTRTLSAFAPARHVAADPLAQTWYGDDRNTVVRFDPVTGLRTPLREIPWLTGVTFDTKRNRLVASNLDTDGTLFSYSPAQNRWTTIASLGGVDMHSTTYSAADDAFYALVGSRDSPLQLLKYNPAGQKTATISLSEPIPATLIGDYQLTAAGDRLSLITPPLPDLYEPHLPPVPRSYLIDPATGMVTYAGVIPEPGAAILLLVFIARRILRRPPRSGAPAPPSHTYAAAACK